MVVGDSRAVLLTAAEEGTVLKTLRHHAENVFAVSWSAANGGRYVATGAEDGKVLVYDARHWCRPVQTIECAVSCARSLHFSPDGGMLLIGETEDAVSVIDGRDGMFERRQTVDFFGDVAGTAWRPDGEAFWVANADAKFGGLMEFEMQKNQLLTPPRWSTWDEWEEPENFDDEGVTYGFDDPSQDGDENDETTQENSPTRTTAFRRNLNLGHIRL